MTTDRIEVQRTIPAPPAAIFGVLCDPQGHVAIDSSGMLMSADGDAVSAVGDTFVVHMDREALNDFPLGHYDVTVEIHTFEQDPPDRLEDAAARSSRRSDHIYGSPSRARRRRCDPRHHRAERDDQVTITTRIPSSPKGRCVRRSGSSGYRRPRVRLALRHGSSAAPPVAGGPVAVHALGRGRRLHDNAPDDATPA
ncbi:MAG: hypothetical protein V9G12_19745 [Microthrixaceae bacterium]